MARSFLGLRRLNGSWRVLHCLGPKDLILNQLGALGPGLLRGENGRGGQIRTDDLYVPNVALYQAKLRPDLSA